jgi:hypothetical protein
MYYIETKLYTLWPVCRFTSDFGRRSRYFCRFYLAVFNAVLTTRITITKYRIRHNLNFDLKKICKNECILIPPNSVATAAV